MSILIVGGDRIDRIRQEFTRRGSNRIEHWSGHKPGDLKRDIPDHVELVVLICNRVNHALAVRVRKTAEQRQLAIIYTRDKQGELRERLNVWRPFTQYQRQLLNWCT